MARNPRRTCRERAASRSLVLAGEARLELKRAHACDMLRIVDAKGAVMISLRVTPEGVTVLLEGVALSVKSKGTLSIEAEQLELRGHQGVIIQSDSDAAIEVAGDLRTSARSQSIVATLGDVHVKANDDVKMDGERVLLNS